MSIEDVFGKSLTVQVDFTLENDLSITCQELEDVFITEIECTSTGGIGEVTASCSYDGEPAQNCKNTHLSNVTP